jgi:chemotaxis protein CheC
MNEATGLSEDQRDCLQEIVNVAMGQAGDSLARFLEVFINLSVPRIRLVDAAHLGGTLIEMVGHADKISAVRQGFYTQGDGNGMRGEAIVLFSDTSFKELADLLAYEDELDEHAERELLLDVTNVLNGACLNGIAEQIQTELAYSPPSVLGQHIPVGDVIAKENLRWLQALLVEINYTLENRSFSCNLLMLMPGEAIDVVKAAMDRLLEDL